MRFAHFQNKFGKLNFSFMKLKNSNLPILEQLVEFYNFFNFLKLRFTYFTTLECKMLLNFRHFEN